MHIQIGKWGNSLGVRIPGNLAKELGLREGSEMDIQSVKGTLVLRQITKPSLRHSLKEILSRVTPENLHGEVDWGTPVGREE